MIKQLKNFIRSVIKNDQHIDEVENKNNPLVVTDFENVVLRIETTNRCNFKCNFCTHSSSKRPKRFMSDELFREIIHEGAEVGIKSLDLRNFGEPLLDKDLHNKTRLAKKLGYENIYIHTNGYLLDLSCFEKLRDAGMNLIIISLSPKREFEITRGKSFDVILENLIQISKLNGRSQVMIDFINTGFSSDEEVQEFKILMDRLGYRIREEIELHNWANGLKISTGPIKMCHRLWTSFTVLVDGSVSLCCLDYEGQMKLGDLNENSILEVINSPLYQALRKSHLDGALYGICEKCDMVYVKDK